MSTIKKQKKTRKSREAEMLSDIENLDIMLGGNHLERVRSEFNPIRGHDSLGYNAPENDEGNSYTNSRENRSTNSANYGHNSAGTDSSAEFNREMDEVMNSVSVQIQRAINDAISNQVLPEIQNALRAGSGQMTQKGWNVSAEKPERNSEDNPSQKIRSSSRSEPFRNCLNDENADSTHDNIQQVTLKRLNFWAFSEEPTWTVPGLLKK